MWPEVYTFHSFPLCWFSHEYSCKTEVRKCQQYKVVAATVCSKYLGSSVFSKWRNRVFSTVYGHHIFRNVQRNRFGDRSLPWPFLIIVLPCVNDSTVSCFLMGVCWLRCCYFQKAWDFTHKICECCYVISMRRPHDQLMLCWHVANLFIPFITNSLLVVRWSACSDPILSNRWLTCRTLVLSICWTFLTASA